MNFTPRELKLLKRLRKQERQWGWARWLRLVAGICSLGLCVAFGFLLHWLISLYLSAAGPINANIVIFILLIWTNCCFYLVFSIWCLVSAGMDWHGNANRTLLLKLLEAQQNGR